jgi:hypothetical protein
MNDTNYSVIKEILITRFEHVNIPTFKFSQINLSQICKDKSKIESFPFIQRTAKFSDKEKLSKAGSAFDKKLTLDIAKLTPELSKFLNKYSNCKLAVIVTDGNNYSHLIYPVTLSQNRSLPGAAKRTNKTSIEISGKWIYSSPFITLDL